MTAVLLCFDVDGTLETSNGPVTLARLTELQDTVGVQVVIVSPSAAAPALFEKRIEGTRVDCLRQAAIDFPAALNFYISDNNDQAAADEARFVYVDRFAFR